MNVALPFYYVNNSDGLIMANLALHNTTLVELQQFLQQMSMPLSEKFTVIFDKNVNDLPILNELAKAQLESDVRQSVDFNQLPAVGMWADRVEMTDTVAYVRQLRQEQWQRQHD